MKNVVFNDTGREIEFKPDRLLDEYRKLTAQDLKAEFSAATLSPRNCPACLSNQQAKAFDKFGFAYVECRSCGTVYMSPAPRDEAIRQHYLTSASSRFWQDNLSKATEDKRIEKIYAPRLQWILDMTREYLPRAKKLASINDKNKSFVQGLARTAQFEQKLVINPYFEAPDLPGARQSVDVVLAFETLDYAADIDRLIGDIKNLLVPGGLSFITTISISGFDQQVLWENSNAIFPPDRINVFSRKGLLQLFGRHGFEVLEYSTPGILDLDVIRHALAKDRDLPIPRFVKNLISEGNEQVFKDFQQFLQVNKLSSFVRILLRKGE